MNVFERISNGFRGQCWPNEPYEMLVTFWNKGKGQNPSNHEIELGSGILGSNFGLIKIDELAKEIKFNPVSISYHVFSSLYVSFLNFTPFSK